MIKPQRAISLLAKTEPKYYITTTLLNSWERMSLAISNTKSSERDKISYEDKQVDNYEKAKAEFIDTLNKIQKPPTEYMQRGLEYESSVYNGEDEVFSPIVNGGEFQAAYQKEIKICGMNIVLYGILDCLKAGIIYDIKRTEYYTPRHYKWSHQHAMYLKLVPSAKKFCYLIRDDVSHHIETYEPANCENIENTIATFFSWLQSNDLMELYKEKWQWDKRKKH